jgi:hypothetical protein
MKKAFFLGLALGVAMFAARADVIPSLSSISPSGTDFTWNYSANVTVDQMIEPGDYFTIYDFGTFLNGSNIQPADWTFSSALLGVTPSLVNPTDSGSILNLTWTYMGQNPIPGSTALGIFSVVTGTNQLTTSDFAAEATRSGDPNGTKVDNVGSISVPVPEMSALLPILSVCAAGLLSLVPSLLRRRQAS